MRIFTSLRSKMMAAILTTVIIIYATSIGYISLKMKQNALNDAETYVDAFIRENANILMADFNKDMHIIRTLAQSFSSWEQLPDGTRANTYREIYRTIFEENRQFLGLWDSWELNKIDSTYTKKHGRYVEEFWREKEKVHNNNSLKCLDGDTDDYARLKKEKKESVEEPYLYSYTGKEDDKVLMTSFIVPIINNEEFTGVVGVDISLDKFQKQIANLKPFDNSQTFLISNKGVFIAHSSQHYINKSVNEFLKEEVTERNIVENINKGNTFSFESEVDGEGQYVTFAPIKIGETQTPWAIGVLVPQNVILAKANKDVRFAIYAGIAGFVLLIIVIWFIAHNITRPINKVVQIAKSCSEGDFSMDIEIERNDEIGELALALKTTTNYFKEVIDLAKKIAAGNLTSEVDRDLANRKGELIEALKKMVERLRAITKNIKTSTESILDTSSNLKSNSLEINNGAIEQEQFSKEVYNSMLKIENISGKAASNIVYGSKNVGSTVDSMKGIVDKTSVINDIYSKTHFIAINAAVEAARAGEVGKGFAIVAQEIQKLAEQSRQAAGDIDEISKSSIVNAEESLTKLKEIVEDIQNTSNLIKSMLGININGHAIDSGNGHTNIKRLEEISNQNLNISEQITSNADDLAIKADNLKEIISFFSTD